MAKPSGFRPGVGLAKGTAMWTNWDRMSLRAHANFVIAMLTAGVLASLIFILLGQVEAAWIVAVVFAGCACGALFRLSLKLPGAADVQDARDAG